MTSYRKLITTRRRRRARPLLDKVQVELRSQQAIWKVIVHKVILVEEVAVLKVEKVALTLEEAVSMCNSQVTWVEIWAVPMTLTIVELWITRLPIWITPEQVSDFLNSIHRALTDLIDPKQ